MSGSGEQADALRAQEQERMIADFKRAVEVSHRVRHPYRPGPSLILPLVTLAISLLALVLAVTR